MGKINVYDRPYHWERKAFEKYVYLYPLTIIKKYLHADSIGIDIGCGDGKITSHLAGMMRKIYGVDHQMKPLQFAHSLVTSENVTLIQADCLHLPFRKSVFDLAFIFDVLEHIPFEQISQLLSEVRGVLKKKGFIFFTTPNRENTLRSKGKIPEKHYFELSYKEALSFLRNHNLKLVEFKGIYLRPSPKKLHRHIKKRKYLYATLTECGKYFPHLCDTFLIVAQC